MSIKFLKRLGRDMMGDFWQVEVTAGHPTITRGVVGKLHDDTQFVVLSEDLPFLFETFLIALRENGNALSPEERERILDVLLDRQ